jgi:hypothetical protein
MSAKLLCIDLHVRCPNHLTTLNSERFQLHTGTLRILRAVPFAIAGQSTHLSQATPDDTLVTNPS